MIGVCKQTFNILLTIFSRMCSINLFLDRTSGFCILDEIPATEILVELQKEDNFIFTTYKPKSLIINCTSRQTEFHVYIAGTYFLNLTGNCTLYTERYKIFKQNVINYSRVTPLPSETMEYKPVPFHAVKDENFEDQIQELKGDLLENEILKREMESKLQVLINDVTIKKGKSDSFTFPNLKDLVDWIPFWGVLDWVFSLILCIIGIIIITFLIRCYFVCTK